MNTIRRTGTPDFNQNPASNPTSQTFNPGEISNRLLMGGGSNSQSGYWLFASGFENGLNELIPNGNVSIENTFVYQGVNSAKIITTNVTDNESAIQKTFFAQGSRYGVECLNAQSLAVGANREFRLRISGRNQLTGQRSVGILVWKITAINASALYYENNGVQTFIANLDDYAQDSGDLFHYIKLCFDTLTNKYIRAYFDDQIFELLDIDGYLQAGTSKETFISIVNKTKSANISTCYVDNIVITAGEP